MTKAVCHATLGCLGPSEWMTSQMMDSKENVSTTTLNYQSLDVKDTILNRKENDRNR